jgi:hypothetical protein
MHRSLPNFCRANGLLVFGIVREQNLDQPQGDMDRRGRQTRGDDETVERRATARLSNEGHGFSRAVNAYALDGLSR